MGAYKNGDRVRVVLEGEVRDTELYDDGRFVVGFNLIRPENEHVVSIEKLEPPVVTFKPGDMVRDQRGGHLRALGKEGYLNITLATYFEYGESLDREDFTSEIYELIKID